MKNVSLVFFTTHYSLFHFLLLSVSSRLDVAIIQFAILKAMQDYTCPMHPEIHQEKPGRCPKCGMKLVLKGSVIAKKADTNSYMPLAIIIGLILLVSFAVSYSAGFSLSKLITNFMIGFFLVFSGLKLIDLSGFAQGYSTYDLLAQRVFGYGYVYPFIELFFGIAMILGFQTKLVLLAEILVMTFSGLGVSVKLARHEKFQCACLGTFLKVPLTKVTVIEDFGMAALALILILRM